MTDILTKPQQPVDPLLYQQRYQDLISVLPHFYARDTDSNLGKLLSALAKMLAQFDDHAKQVLYARWIDTAQPFDLLQLSQEKQPCNYQPIDLLAKFTDCQRLPGRELLQGESDQELRWRTKRTVKIIQQHSITSIYGVLDAAATAMDLMLFRDQIKPYIDSFIVPLWPAPTRYSQACLYYNDLGIETDVKPVAEISLIENPLIQQTRQFSFQNGDKTENGQNLFSFINPGITSDCPVIILRADADITDLTLVNDQKEIMSYAGTLKAGSKLILKPIFDDKIHQQIIQSKKNSQSLITADWLEQYPEGYAVVELNSANTTVLQSVSYTIGKAFGTSGDASGARFAAHADPLNPINAKIPNTAYFGISFSKRVIAPVIHPGLNEWKCYQGKGVNIKPIQAQLNLTWWTRASSTIEVMVQETNEIRERQYQIPEMKPLVRRYIDWSKAAGVVALLSFHNKMYEKHDISSELYIKINYKTPEQYSLIDNIYSINISKSDQERLDLTYHTAGVFDQPDAILNQIQYGVADVGLRYKDQWNKITAASSNTEKIFLIENNKFSLQWQGTEEMSLSDQLVVTVCSTGSETQEVNDYLIGGYDQYISKFDGFYYTSK